MVSDVELLNCYTKFNSESGDMARAFMESLEDGDIEQHEFLRIEREMREMITAALELLERIRALVVKA